MDAKRERHDNAKEPAPARPGQAEGAAIGETERVQAELAQSKEQYLRLAAEFDNAKKRMQREKDEFAKYATEGMVRRLLPILDSLDHALRAVEGQANPDAIAKGVQLIQREITALLAREGVQRIAAAEGQPFDPHLHEAVAQVEPSNGQADNTIQEEVHAGYTMHGKVIRPAMVKVATGGPHNG
jgi:molecular chaperone GrpE